MSQFAKNVSFITFDLVDYALAKPEVCGRAFQTVLTLLQAGRARPMTPITVCPASDVQNALRTMQSGKHLGKLVLSLSPNDQVKAYPSRPPRVILTGNATYLIIGGLGGLGQAIARWMAHHGGRHLVLASRSGRRGPEEENLEHEMEKHGARVHIMQCNVADADQVRYLIETCSKSLPPIRGVVHSAMILRDSLLQNMSFDEWTQSLQPKVQGALNLHEQLPNDLDFFIMLSSVCAVIGNVSQANYAAANTFLDNLANHRNRFGLPGISLALGAMGEVGFVARDPKLAQEMARQGFQLTTQQELLTLIEYGIHNPRAVSPFGHIISGLGTWKQGASLTGLNRPVFSHFRLLTAQDTGEPEDLGNGGSLIAKLRALPFAEAESKVRTELASRVAALCMISPEDVVPSKTLTQYGMDSLTAVEMRNWIHHLFQVTIPILELLGSSSLQALSTRICRVHSKE